MTYFFAGYLIYIKAIDGFGGLGRLSKEYNEYRDSRDWSVRMLSFTDYLRQQFPDQWIAYQTYRRLTNKE
jgi:hypothetical protein